MDSHESKIRIEIGRLKAERDRIERQIQQQYLLLGELHNGRANDTGSSYASSRVGSFPLPMGVSQAEGGTHRCY